MIVDPAQALLDLSTTLRDRGAEGALSSSPEWAAEAWDVLKSLARSGRPFSVNDIRERVGPGPSSGSCGAVVLNGLKAKWIRHFDDERARHVEAHARRIGVYTGTDKARSS